MNPVADDGSGIQDGPSCKQRVNTVQTIDTLCRQLFRDDSELEKVYLTLLFGVRADYPGAVELGDDCDEALERFIRENALIERFKDRKVK